jgi:hypothetical protein
MYARLDEIELASQLPWFEARGCHGSSGFSASKACTVLTEP